jgi:hypothetical protein
MGRDPLVKLLEATLPLPVPFVERLTTLCKPYWRFLVSDEAREQVTLFTAVGFRCCSRVYRAESLHGLCDLGTSSFVVPSRVPR